MNDQPDPHGVMPAAPQTVSIEERELIRDWEFLFFAFLLFGLGRLVLARPLPTRAPVVSCGSIVRVRVLWHPRVFDAMGIQAMIGSMEVMNGTYKYI